MRVGTARSADPSRAEAAGVEAAWCRLVQEAMTRNGSEANGHDPNVRKRLAQHAAEDYELIRTAIREAAQATKTVWHTCRFCNRRDQIEVQDAHAAIKAAEIYLNQGFGRPKETAGDSGDFVFVRKVVKPGLAPATLERLLAVARARDDDAELQAALAAVEAELANETVLSKESTSTHQRLMGEPTLHQAVVRARRLETLHAMLLPELIRYAERGEQEEVEAGLELYRRNRKRLAAKEAQRRRAA